LATYDGAFLADTVNTTVDYSLVWYICVVQQITRSVNQFDALFLCDNPRVSCFFLWYNEAHSRTRRESCATAKMTARCVLYAIPP